MSVEKRQLYLGRQLNPGDGADTGGQLLYDADELTTHAVCFGMTGSGKTGLCLVLLEEVLRCGIPAFMIDPKGDLANLLLTFPGLTPAEFEPWIDPQEARAAGHTPAQHAEDAANRWRQGLAASGLGPAEIRALREGVDIVLYTPGSTAARPLNILGGFAPPSGDATTAWETDPEPLRARIAGTVAALLALVDRDDDPVRSPEGIFLARLFELKWKTGDTLTLEAMIRELQNPGESMRTLGAIDTETMLPLPRRMQLALALNGLLAAPSFSAWTQGDPLDIARMIGPTGSGGTGKPRACILYIAHLSDQERSFFVATFLQSLITWMRTQPGTSSLRALLYMDEIFGYFPPTANPPTKEPLLTLLKQARAFGLGVVLATQNPVDVDYKGLANAGTWFIGKLQTDQDRNRLLDGLAGSASIDRAAIEKILAGLPPRTFLLHNVHDPGLKLFSTRWAMSYLRGPMTREEVRRLAAGAGPMGRSAAAAGPGPAAAPVSGRAIRENAPTGVPEWFAATEAGTVLTPWLRAKTRVMFEETRAGLRELTEEDLILPLGSIHGAGDLEWANAVPLQPEVTTEPPAQAVFDDLPDLFRSPAVFKKAAVSLAGHLVLTRTLSLRRCEALKMTSRAGETLESFKQRCLDEAGLKEEAETGALRARYEEKLRRLQTRAEKELRELERDKQALAGRKVDELVSAGETLLGMFLGGRRRTLSGAITRRRMTSNSGVSVEKSAAEYESAQTDLTRMQEEARQAIEELEDRWDAAADGITELIIRPKKRGVEVIELGIVWLRK